MRLPDGTAAFVAGAGPALVFLHGVGLDKRMWAAQVHGLARSHTVVTYDLMGHGKTPPIIGEAALEDWVMQLERVARGLRLERFSLVGFSFGGMIAQGFAVKHPERLQRLVLMSTVYERSAEERAGVEARLKLARKEAPLPSSRRHWSAGSRPPSPAVAGDRPGIQPASADNDPESFLAAYACFASADRELAGRLGTISCPTLVMTGELDRGSTPDMARKMAAVIPKRPLHSAAGTAYDARGDGR